MHVLAGDIGGTSARLALADVAPDATTYNIITETHYNSRDWPGLAPIAEDFLHRTGAKPASACFAVAGPVVGEECRASNLPWLIHRGELAAAIGVERTLLINDFTATGHALALLRAEDLVTLQEGTAADGAPRALIGAGTGLGAGFVLTVGGRPLVCASEGGHSGFAPTDALQCRLVQYLWREYGHASWERVLSGAGLVNLYRFLASDGFAPESDAVRQELADEEDDAAVVSRHGIAGDDALSVKALELFVTAYGAAAGDLAVTLMAAGGVYVAGGIAPKIIAKMRDGAFVKSFRKKGRLSDFLASVPVYVIVNTHAGLIGAVAAAAGGAEQYPVVYDVVRGASGSSDSSGSCVAW